MFERTIGFTVIQVDKPENSSMCIIRMPLFHYHNMTTVLRELIHCCESLTKPHHDLASVEHFLGILIAVEIRSVHFNDSQLAILK